MNDLYLLADIADVRFAIPAERVVSVAGSMDIVPVPLAAASIAGIAALRSKVIAIVDVEAAVAGGAAGDCTGKPVIVSDIGGHLYGLAVDRLHDIVAADGPPRAIEAPAPAAWRRLSIGFVETPGGAVAVVDPDGLVEERADAA